ncbi:MAG TPA: nicotinate-nucleotide--dimethylbenzimidazole phosphoribosyltransferase [Dehalococcoidia bacterium]|nr:nicotinate-nucleotide--dimethylbenzimidazole phosphoribosyltransferase [Dehalococcoidia bacterium]
MGALEKTVKRITGLDEAAMAAARRRQDTLTKPLGSLGRLEEISVHLAGIFAQPIPIPRGKTIILGAADHGVADEGVSAYPREVTAQMVLNFLRGGAGINVLARYVGAEVVVVDAGVAAELPSHPALHSAKVGWGTANIARGPAMSREQAIRAVESGISIAEEAIARGADLIGTGDMGIANTTPSSAIVAAITGREPEVVTGKGTGISEEGLRHKAGVVRQALEVNHPNPSDALDVLAKVGGFEIGLLAGVILGTAASRRVAVLDGFISGAAALIAHGICPRAGDYLVASHLSAEPGHQAVLSNLGLKPLLNLDLRLGEGTGAALSMLVIEAAARCLAEMATFADAGVSEKKAEET